MDKIEKIIIEAFCELICDKGYKGINITNLTEKRGINRTTFYEYFQNKRELAETICYNFMDEYMSLVSDDFKNITSPAFRESLKKSYSFLDKNRKLVIALWEIGEDGLIPYRIMQRKYYETIIKRIDQKFDVSDFKKNIFAYSVSGSAMSANMYYIFNENLDLDDFVDIVLQSITKGDMSLLKE